MKKYTYKVYKSNGNYITSWADASFDGFKKTINGGLGECKIKLARQFDDFGENDDVKLNNKIEIICSDGDTPSTGMKIYSGFISNYTPYIDGNSEGVEITLLGYVSKLGTSILKNSTQIELKTDTAAGLTTGATASAAEARDVVTAIIDRYQTEAKNPIINYSTTSTEDSGNTFTYTFNAKKYNEALDICREYAPSNWWWYVGADNVLKFKPKPNLADHKFVFGKHFKAIKVEKNMENVVNRVLFSSGDNPDTQILKIYSDTDSSDLYDDRWEVVTDNRVSVSETADNAGESTLAEKKNADVKTTIEILDNNGNPNGYDIESINPGDTCKFLNLNTITSQTFSGNMVIRSVDYTPDKVVIEIESLSVSAGKEIVDNKKKIEAGEATGRATSYDTDTDKWIAPTLINSWVNLGGAYSPAGYTKDNLGFVHLRGLIKDGAVSQNAFVLPAGYRPPYRLMFAVVSGGVLGVLEILANGGALISTGSNAYFSFDGITFKT
ncbi:MAG TPA: hypothetical protein VMV56_11915 [Williamwhitmania sp.]|nr:hypothetical protein [Williamwhitmania sp.]